MRTLLALCLTATLGACGKAPELPEIMKGTFSSMRECLSTLERSAGKLNIVTNRPDEVSGLLERGGGFGCKRVETGTSGVVYEGWHDLPRAS